jgi:hypothetical protein
LLLFIHKQFSFPFLFPVQFREKFDYFPRFSLHPFSSLIISEPVVTLSYRVPMFSKSRSVQTRKVLNDPYFLKLIKSKTLRSGEVLQYRKGSKVILGGKASRRGILCDCCKKHFEVAKFVRHSLRISRRPFEEIFDSQGASLKQLTDRKQERAANPTANLKTSTRPGSVSAVSPFSFLFTVPSFDRALLSV